MAFLNAPTTSDCRTSPMIFDDFRTFPMTADFQTIVPQRNQSEGSQTIQIICMTVRIKLTPNAAKIEASSSQTQCPVFKRLQRHIDE